MRHRNLRIGSASLLVLAILQPCVAHADDKNTSSDELAALYGADQSITLATGYTRALFDAPASATIVSRDEIERLGVNNLAELLQTVSAYYLSTNDAHSTTITV